MSDVLPVEIELAATLEMCLLNAYVMIPAVKDKQSASRRRQEEKTIFGEGIRIKQTATLSLVADFVLLSLICIGESIHFFGEVR